MQQTDRVISVVMVMSNTLYRQGLSMLLESSGDVSVVAQADSCALAVEAITRTTPDVLVIELADPDAAPETADLVACAAASSRSGIVVLAGYEDAETIFSLFDAGVRGYVLRENQAETLIDAVRAIARGEYVVDTHVVGALLTAARDMRRRIDARCPDERPSVLTTRQGELLHLVAEGLTNRQIAASLGISESTVKNHLHQVFAKLGVTSRSQAISVGVRMGILRP